MKQKTCFKPKYQYLSFNNYLQGLSKSYCACITDIVLLQVELLEGLVQLQEIDRKDGLVAAANQTQNTWKLDVEGSQQRL